MTDGKLVRVMARIYRLNEEILYLIEEEVFDHPNGEALRGKLHDNGLGYSCNIASITHPHLTNPHRWECIDGCKLKRKAADAAKGGER